jgi:hypothetical protein
MPAGLDDEGDGSGKYVKRVGSARRTLQRLFPGVFQPTLPVTTRRGSFAHFAGRKAGDPWPSQNRRRASLNRLTRRAGMRVLCMAAKQRDTVPCALFRMRNRTKNLSIGCSDVGSPEPLASWGGLDLGVPGTLTGRVMDGAAGT